MRNELYDPVTGDYYDQTGAGEVGSGDAVGNRTMGDASVGDTSASYTPHLLPIFQHNGNTLHGNGHPQAANHGHGQANGQGQGRHSRNVSGGDPNHLEDASVLLSMAYGLDNEKLPDQSEMGAAEGTQGGNAGAMMGDAPPGSTGPTQDELTKAALDNAMNNLFNDTAWMGNTSGGVTAPSKEQVQSVSDWVCSFDPSSSSFIETLACLPITQCRAKVTTDVQMSGDMPLIDPALTGLSGSDVSAPSNGDTASRRNGASGADNCKINAQTSASSKSTDDSSSSTPLSPFPLASLFSPSLFAGLSLPASGGDSSSTFGSAGSASDAFLAAAGFGNAASMGTHGQQATGNAVNGPGSSGFNFDLGSPAGIYNTLNTLNMWNAGSGGGGSLGPFDTRMFANAQQNANQQGNAYGGTNNGAFDLGASPFNLGAGWLSSSNPGPNTGNAHNGNGDVFPSNAANQFGFNDAQMSLLEQMAKYQLPQTHVNPNPERPIMRIEHGAMRERQGPQSLTYDARF
jgi:hypothetical protein